MDSRSPHTSSGIVAKSRAYIQETLDRVLGHDFFIAHGHADEDSFPERLFLALKSQGFSVFLDKQGGYHGGDELEKGTRRFASNARRLVVISGRHALSSRWVRDEIGASQSRNRVQIVVDDPEASFATVSANNPIKKRLHSRRWLSRQPDDQNFEQIVLDLASGFSGYRRETRTLLALAGGIIVVLLTVLLTVWFAYERQRALDAERTQRLLAESGQLTTRVQAALRARPPLREMAARIAMESVIRTSEVEGLVPSSSEQALRDTLEIIGGRPLTCGGADGLPLAEAPIQVAGVLIANARGPKYCAWRADNLRFLGSQPRPAPVTRQLDQKAALLWTVDQEGRLHRMAVNGEEWFSMRFAQLTDFVSEAEEDDLSLGPETTFIGSQIVQFDGVGRIRIWTRPLHPVASIEPIEFPIRTSRFDVFHTQKRILIEVEYPARDTDDMPPELCLLDVSSLECDPLPAGVPRNSPLYTSLSPDGGRLLTLSASELVVFEQAVGWKRLAKLDPGRLGADFVFATFLPSDGRVFASTESGASAIWQPASDSLERLPIAHTPLASAHGTRTWFSPDGEWLIVADILRGVTGYRLGKSDQSDQKHYPLTTTIEVSTRTTTLGGELTGSPSGRHVAFADHGVDAVLLTPNDASLVVRRRLLRGHELPVTDLTFSNDSSRLFTVDLSGAARVWSTSAERMSAAPIAILISETRFPQPDQGDFVTEDDLLLFIGDVFLFVLPLETSGSILVSSSFNTQRVFYLDKKFDGELTIRERELRLDDFSPEWGVPDYISLEAARHSIEGLLLDEDDHKDVLQAVALWSGRVLVVFADDGLVRVFRPDTPKGQSVRKEDGSLLRWTSTFHAVDRTNGRIFLFSDEGTICRITLAAPPSAQAGKGPPTQAVHGVSHLRERTTCFVLPDKSKPPEDLVFIPSEYFPTGKDHLLIGRQRLLTLNDADATIDDKTRPRSPCTDDLSLSGRSGRWLYETCDKKAVVTDLVDLEQAPLTFD